MIFFSDFYLSLWSRLSEKTLHSVICKLGGSKGENGTDQY